MTINQILAIVSPLTLATLIWGIFQFYQKRKFEKNDRIRNTQNEFNINFLTSFGIINSILLELLNENYRFQLELESRVRNCKNVEDGLDLTYKILTDDLKLNKNLMYKLDNGEEIEQEDEADLNEFIKNNPEQVAENFKQLIDSFNNTELAHEKSEELKVEHKIKLEERETEFRSNLKQEFQKLNTIPVLSNDRKITELTVEIKKEISELIILMDNDSLFDLNGIIKMEKAEKILKITFYIRLLSEALNQKIK